MATSKATMAQNHDALGLALRYLLESRDSLRRPRVLLLSPVKEDIVFVRGLVPDGDFYASDRFIWDINNRFESLGPMFDVVIASNVFHYSPDPEKWFGNVFGATRYLVIQDLVERKRSGKNPFLGTDGDCVRYSYVEKGVISNFPNSFDLGRLGDAILWFHDYAGVRNDFHPVPESAPRHFVLVAEGPLVEVPCRGAGGKLKFKLCLFGISSGIFYRALKKLVEWRFR
jgi:hypothetical protein